MKPVFIAVIAVVIIAIVGVGVYFAFFNGGDEKLDVDNVKETIVVGDNIDFDMSVSADNESEGEMPAQSVLYLLYYDLEGATKIGTEQITYKSRTIDCDVYEISFFSTSKYWVDPDSKIVYKMASSMGLETTTTLSDTSFDTSLTEIEQEVVAGSYINFDITLKVTVNGVKVDLAGTAKYNVTADLGDGSFKTKSVTNLSGIASVNEKVVAIDGDELTIDTSDEKVSKEKFRAFVCYDDFKSYLEDMGTVVESDKKPMGAMNVATGKRNITEQDLELTVDEQKIAYTLQFGDNGALYSIKYGSGEQGVVIIIKNSSLFVKA